MNQVNQQKLFSTFPRLYRVAAGASGYGMFWGIECGDGWLDLLMKLSEAIETQAHQDGCSDIGWPAVTGIKQKYGLLDFTMHGVTDANWDMICSAESQSQYICESCGEPGHLHEDSWINVYCPECYSKR